MITQRAPFSPPQLESFLQRYGNQQSRLRQDVYTLLQNTPTLLPTQDTFIANDGTSRLMLLLEGTLPISFRGNIYHIPVNIWIHDNYPNAPPISFVVPTKDMLIKSRHHSVDATGLCYLSYLKQWRPETCNLIGLVLSMIQIFSTDPPVFAKPPNYVEPTTNNLTYPQQISNPVQTPNNPITKQTLLPQSPPKSTDVKQNTSLLLSSNGVRTGNRPSQLELRKIVEEKLIAECARVYNTLKQETEQFLKIQTQLDKNEQLIQQTLESYQKDEQQLQKNSEILDLAIRESDEWLINYENVKLNIDDVVTPEDSLSQQMFDLVAEDASIEDTLYFLNRALESDNIDVDNFLKTYRNLAREQFMKRLACKKVFEAQHHGIIGNNTILRTGW